MLNIDLQIDEVLILNDETAYLDKKMGELFLTNKRLVWAKKTAFGNKIKEMKELPLSQIKMYNGEPQVRVTGQLMEPELQIQHNGGIATISFMNKRTTNNWMDEIHIAITGQKSSSSSDRLGNLAIPGMDILGKGIKDSVGAFAAGLGVKNKLIKDKNVTTTCSACGAPISGIKGEKIICEFCGTAQVLK